jgi:two-component system, OmpR family, sensor histidine kinase PfeS
MIYVDDQGTGVSEDYIEDIFKPFFRIQKEQTVGTHNNAISSKKSGYGLGLALAKRQILALDGTIKAMNRYDDTLTIQGLTLLITIPLSKKAPSALSH